MQLRLIPCLCLVALVLSNGVAHAQSVLGLGDDALTLPRGVVRVRVSTTIAEFSQRYGKGTPGRADGSLEPLAIDLNLDTVGVIQFPNLVPVQNGLRALTGLSGFSLTLGRTIVTAQARVQTSPIVLEAGLTNRLSLGVVIPIVSARNEISFNANPRGTEGNVGFNPIRNDTSLFAQNRALISQLSSARDQLATLITTCTANPSASPFCAAALANGPALNTSTTAFAGGIGQIYGTSSTTGSPFVPRTGSTADTVIRQRVSSLKSSYQAFGITNIVSNGPAAATGVVTPDGAQRVLTDSAFGIIAAPLRTFTRQGLGDIELALKLRLLDGIGGKSDTARFNPKGVAWRQSVTGLVRLGTGTLESPDNFVDLSTGNGQTDVEVRSLTDVVIGRRWFTSLAARYVVQLPDAQTFRIIDAPDRQLAPLYRRRAVDRDLGDQLEVELTPRLLINDYFAIGAQYFFRQKGADSFTGSYTVPTAESGLTAPLALDASTLNLETSAQEHRLGWGLTFSTVAAFARGTAKLPLDVQYFNTRTVRGAGGAVAKLSVHQLQFRFYGRLFGRK
jgi:hypothetical protein